MSEYALCCCCLELPCLKSLWSQYMWMGHSEVYAHMLKECFDLSWQQKDNTNFNICEICITQLRSALRFKKRIIQCQARLETTLIDLKISIEMEKVKTEPKEPDLVTLPHTEVLHDNESINDYYDDCDKTDDNNDMINEDGKKRRLLIISKDKKHSKIQFRKANYIKPRQNVGLILEHSTITPFKSTKGYFTCLYCNKQQVTFDELKNHVNENHAKISFKNIIKSLYKPHDRVKADVSDINCKICKKKIYNLETLVTHLSEHNIKFNYDTKPADSILPYDLNNGQYKCYVCEKEFLFFKTLTNHMNIHSSDYICDVCGRCFLLQDRLRAHKLMHIDIKSAKCNICDKICASNVLLRSHIRHNHKKLSFMCSLCNETFPSYRLRLQHLEVVHNRFLNLTCKICNKKYITPSSLNSHMRKEHLKISKNCEAKHCCNICGMLFKSPNALSCHIVVHSGEKKFECDVCHKKFARAKSLTEHLKIHRNDRRWTCRACAQAFVQKCSLKNHIRVHHVDNNYEQLIVYKKPDG